MSICKNSGIFYKQILIQNTGRLKVFFRRPCCATWFLRSVSVFLILSARSRLSEHFPAAMGVPGCQPAIADIFCLAVTGWSWHERLDRAAVLPSCMAYPPNKLTFT